MGIVTNCFTDYGGCTDAPQTFLQMLANCIVIYADERGVEHTYLNTIVDYDYCEDAEDFWTCDNNGGKLDPERALVQNLFALDDCGRMALKLFYSYCNVEQ